MLVLSYGKAWGMGIYGVKHLLHNNWYYLRFLHHFFFSSPLFCFLPHPLLYFCFHAKLEPAPKLHHSCAFNVRAVLFLFRAWGDEGEERRELIIVDYCYKCLGTGPSRSRDIRRDDRHFIIHVNRRLDDVSVISWRWIRCICHGEDCGRGECKLAVNCL